MAILLTMLLVGCQSLKTEKIVVPEIEFPEFPLSDEIINNLDGTCTVPTKWIIQLRLYQIEIEKTQKDYEGIKEVYSNQFS